eukprot:tig00000492_g1523.t1
MDDVGRFYAASYYGPSGVDKFFSGHSAGATPVIQGAADSVNDSMNRYLPQNLQGYGFALVVAALAGAGTYYYLKPAKPTDPPPQTDPVTAAVGAAALAGFGAYYLTR